MEDLTKLLDEAQISLNSADLLLRTSANLGGDDLEDTLIDIEAQIGAAYYCLNTVGAAIRKWDGEDDYEAVVPTGSLERQVDVGWDLLEKFDEILRYYYK